VTGTGAGRMSEPASTLSSPAAALNAERDGGVTQQNRTEERSWMRTAVAVLAIASVLVFTSVSARADERSAGSEVASARSQIDASLAQMRATSLRVRDQLRTARKRGTRAQITCVDEALSRSDVAFRRARELGDETLAAYARSDLDGARASLRRLAELKESQRLAATSATSCGPNQVIPVASASSATTVRLEISPTIAPVP